jgi:hypothetical protein
LEVASEKSRRGSGDPKWRRKPLKSLKTDSQMAPARWRSRARRINQANSV